jgi:hypothetical protein
MSEERSIREKLEVPKDEEIEKTLETISKTGEKRFVSTSIYSNDDIRNFLYYSSKMLKTPELNMELQYLVGHPGSSKVEDTYPTIFEYEELPKEKLLLAAWYSGEKEEDAYRRTDTHYIIAEQKKINGIVTFKDDKISRDFLYVYVSGRFASKDELTIPSFWDLRKVHCKSLRDLILYIIPDEDLKKLGIEFEAAKLAEEDSKETPAEETKEDKEEDKQ